jgi:hypothetical protein
MKTFSKTFNFPLSDKTIQSKELLQTMQEIAQSISLLTLG